MTPTPPSSSQTPADRRLPLPPRPSYACPHCGGALDLETPAPLDCGRSNSASERILDGARVGAAGEGESPQPSPFAQWLNRSSSLFFPLTHALLSPQVTPAHPARSRRMPSPILQGAALLLPVALVLVWSLVRGDGQGQPASTPQTESGSATALSTATTAEPLNTDQAAVLAVVAAYNAADAEVAATLSLDPVRRYLDEAGPLWERREQEIARRKETHAPHTSRLLRWAVGTIAVDQGRITATIVTQETWEDRSETMGAHTATVRVVYTLRRADVQAAWCIYDAMSTVL